MCLVRIYIIGKCGHNGKSQLGTRLRSGGKRKKTGSNRKNIVERSKPSGTLESGRKRHPFPSQHYLSARFARRFFLLFPTMRILVPGQERVSLVGALLLLLECLFFVFKVYYKESLIEPICFSEQPLHLRCLFRNFLQLVELALSSRSFVFAFDDAILYPYLLGGKMKSVRSKIIQPSAGLKCVPRSENLHVLTLFPLDTIIS